MLNQYFRKYQQMSEPAKAAVWFTICSVIQKGISFITMPLFTRLLNKEEYGVYTVFTSWYMILSIPMTLNLSQGVYNNAVLKFKNKPKVTSAFFGLTILNATVWLGIYWLFLKKVSTPFFGVSTRFILLIYLEAVSQSAFLLWAAGERFDYKYKALVFVTLMITVLDTGGSVAAIFLMPDRSMARILAHVVVDVAVGFILGIHIWIRSPHFYDKEYWKYAFKFNIPLIPHYLSMTILNQSDRIMIDKMAGTEQAAVYGVAYTLSSMMNIVAIAINASFTPYTYRSILNKEYRKVRKTASDLLLLMAALCGLTMLVGPELIWIVGGNAYMEAIWTVPPVAASVFFMFLYPLFGNIEFYFEKTGYVLVASCSGAIANLILNFFFIRRYGYLAASYTTLFCYIMFSFFHYFFYRRIAKMEGIQEEIFDSRRIIGLSLLVLLTMLIMLEFYQSTILRYLLIVLCVGVLFWKRFWKRKEI